MEQPYYILNLNFSLNDKWKTYADNNETRQVIIDKNCDMLSSITKSVFEDLGFQVEYALLWSWPRMLGYGTKVYGHPYEDHFHIDYPLRYGAEVAINYLIRGDPGKTEWVDMKYVTHVGTANNPAYERQSHNDVQLFLNNGGEVVQAILQPDKPMLACINVPHRVVTSDIIDTRWAYSLRLLDKKTNKSVTWETAKKYLRNHLV
jgi:hypothetical protein